MALREGTGDPDSMIRETPHERAVNAVAAVSITSKAKCTLPLLIERNSQQCEEVRGAPIGSDNFLRSVTILFYS